MIRSFKRRMVRSQSYGVTRNDRRIARAYGYLAAGVGGRQTVTEYEKRRKVFAKGDKP